jgi:Myb/SANT-like DNA-binding domain
MGNRRKPDVVDLEGGGVTRPDRRAAYAWNEKTERFFIDLIVQGIRAGKRHAGHFKDQFWKDCITLFETNNLPVPALDTLNSKRSVWLKKWKTFHRLIQLSGWGFDEATGLLQASDEAWEEQIRIDPEAKYFRRNPLKYRLEMEEIFLEVAASGRYAQGNTDNNPIIVTDSVTVADPTLVAETQSRSSTPLKRDASQASLPTTTTSSKRRKDEMTEVLKAISNRLGNSTTTEDLKIKAIEILQAEFNDLDTDEFNIALDIVESHPSTFVTLTTERRGTWLMAKISQSLSN